MRELSSDKGEHPEVVVHCPLVSPVRYTPERSGGLDNAGVKPERPHTQKTYHQGQYALGTSPSPLKYGSPP